MGGAAPARAAGAAEAAALAAAYVGAIYAARAPGALAAAAAARGAPPQPPPPPPPPRDDPREIARRARAVSGAAAAVAVYTRLRCGPEPLTRINGGEAASGVALLRGGALAVAATSALFLGPTVQAWLDGVTPASAVHALWHRLRSPSGMRDLLVAPVTEEVVFRGGACAVMARAGWSRAAVTYLSPLGFSVAHLHHLIEARRRGVPLARAVLSAAAQLSYTTVFGWYAAHLYISTGTLVAPIVAHAIANHYGLPDFGGAAAHPQRPAVLTAYAVGMGAFAWALVEAPRASPL